MIERADSKYKVGYVTPSSSPSAVFKADKYLGIDDTLRELNRLHSALVAATSHIRSRNNGYDDGLIDDLEYVLNDTSNGVSYR